MKEKMTMGVTNLGFQWLKASGKGRGGRMAVAGGDGQWWANARREGRVSGREGQEAASGGQIKERKGGCGEKFWFKILGFCP